MKYTNKKWSHGVGSKAYRENWANIFESKTNMDFLTAATEQYKTLSENPMKNKIESFNIVYEQIENMCKNNMESEVIDLVKNLNFQDYPTDIINALHDAVITNVQDTSQISTVLKTMEAYI